RHPRNTMDQETAIQICGLIAGVLSADEDMHPHEASFLQRVRQRFALPKGARVTPVVDPARAVEELAGMAEDVRGEAFDLLVQAAAADGKIAPAERTFLSALAD